MEIARFLLPINLLIKLYPGSKSFPQYQLVKSQMDGFGGIISFYLKGDLENIKRFLEIRNFFISRIFRRGRKLN